MEHVAWNMADAVPGLGVPTVWSWERPLRVEGDLAWFAGLPVFAARAFVAIVVVGLLVDVLGPLIRGRTSSVER